MNFKKMSAKVMAVLMAVLMMTGVFAPAVSAVSMDDYLNEVDGFYNEYEDLYNEFCKEFEDLSNETENKFEDLYAKVEEYIENADEEYAKLYAQAVADGTIAAIVAYLAEAKNYVNFAKDFALDYEEYFRSEELGAQITAAAENANVTIDALIALIETADKLDAETYAEAMKLLAALKVNLADLATVLGTVAEDAYEYAAPYVEEALAILNAKINEALEIVAEVKAEINSTIAGLREVVKNFLANSAFHADYTVSENSFILAIGNDTAYAALLAEKLGLDATQFGTIGWADLQSDSSIIAKADLITIGYDASKFASFTVDQVIAYVLNYVNGDLRNETNAYVEDAMNYFFAEYLPFFGAGFVNGKIEEGKDQVNDVFDEVLANEMIPAVEASDLDWAKLVGAENVEVVKTVVDALVAELEAKGVIANLNNKLLSAISDMADGLLVIEDGMIKFEVAKLVVGLVPEFEIDANDAEEALGEYANYYVELPVEAVVATAIESYFYSYIKFNVEYAQTVFAINTINPDAKVVLLSGYNTLDTHGFDFVIDDVVIELGEIFTSDIQDSANSVIDTVYGEFFGIATKENAETVIDTVLPVIDVTIKTIAEQIRAAQTAGAEFDVVAAVNSIEINPEELIALVGEENITYALKLVAAVKFVLVKTGAIETIIDRMPTEAEMLALLAQVEADLNKLNADLEEGLHNLDPVIVEALNDLKLTLPEIRVLISNFVDYALEATEEAALNIKDLFNEIYDMIEGTDIVIEGTTLDLGAIFGSIVPGTTSIHSLVYAFSMKNVIVVDICGVETLADGLTGEDFISALIYGELVNNISEAGHAYIADQIYDALNVTCAHRDTNKDHVCDYCEAVLSECEDLNKDHFCDYCGVELSKCADADKNHFCDYCGAELSKCADNDKDHKCDYCGKELTPCVDANKDHKCDNGCSKTFGEHVDANKDHVCDYGCAEKIGEHVDANKDHNCDYGCSERIGGACADDNHDHNCDYCGAKISECAWGEWEVVTEATKRSEGEEKRTCSICGAVETRVIPEIPGLTAIAVIGIVAGSAVVAGGAGFAVYYFVFKKKSLVK